MNNAKTREAVKAVIGACRGLLAALEEEGSEADGAGARAARGSERLPQPTSSDRIGTQVAFSQEQEKEALSICLSSSSSASESIWERILRMTETEIGSAAVQQLVAGVRRHFGDAPSAYWRRQNCRLITAAAVISLVCGPAGRDWLAAALERTVMRATRNRYGFFRACLITSLRELDPTLLPQAPGEDHCPSAIFRRIVERLAIPQTWLEEAGRPPQKPPEPPGRAMPDVDPQELAAWQAHLDTELARRRGLRKAE